MSFPAMPVSNVVYVQGLRPNDEVDDKVTDKSINKVDLDDLDERIGRVAISSRASEDVRSPSPLPVDSKPATPVIPEQPKTLSMPELYFLSEIPRTHNNPFEFPPYAASGDAYYEARRQKALNALNK